MTTTSPSGQMALPVGLRDHAVFANFYAPASAHVVAAVRGLSMARSSASVFVFGDTGSGKTHLCRAACRHARDAGDSILYIPMRETVVVRELLANPPASALVCMDDLDAVASDAGFSEVLFRFIEELNHVPRLRILFTANRAPRELGIPLPDLLSRINAAPAYQLMSLSDPEKAEALRLRAKARGLEIPDEVVAYILRHHARDTAALFGLLDRIDESTLAAKRKVSLPLVRELLRN